MSTIPRSTRRRFQFSLGSMFVLMTLVAMWLAWELSFIRQRQVWIRDHESWLVAGPRTVPEASIPWWRGLLGDEAVPSILVGVETPAEERNHVQKLFPEAVTWSATPVMSGTGSYLSFPDQTTTDGLPTGNEQKPSDKTDYGPPLPPLLKQSGSEDVYIFQAPPAAAP
jgi:hypothetical protein